jgi:hypothetical protein
MQTMKKLKEELISLCSILVLIILFIGCKVRLDKQENTDKQKVISGKTILAKEAFFSCTDARDTVFANGDYIKYISIDNEYYEIEIKINEVLDTLEMHLSCKTHSGMIPNFLFRSNLGYLGLGQGSSSYRYLTLFSLDNEAKKINISRFETAIDVSSEKDGFIFIKENWLFLYEENQKKFLCKKILSDGKKFNSNEFVLYKNRVSIISKDGNIHNYFLNEFMLKDSIP